MYKQSISFLSSPGCTKHGEQPFVRTLPTRTRSNPGGTSQVKGQKVVGWWREEVLGRWCSSLGCLRRQRRVAIRSAVDDGFVVLVGLLRILK